MLLGPVDDGVIRPETEPIVRGQGGHVVTQEKEDAQKGDEKPNRLHVVPVHGQLDLEPGEKASYRTHPPSHAYPRSGASTDPVQSSAPTCAHAYNPLPLQLLGKEISRSKAKVSALMELPVEQ